MDGNSASELQKAMEHSKVSHLELYTQVHFSSPQIYEIDASVEYVLDGAPRSTQSAIPENEDARRLLDTTSKPTPADTLKYELGYEADDEADEDNRVGVVKLSSARTTRSSRDKAVHTSGIESNAYGNGLETTAPTTLASSFLEFVSLSDNTDSHTPDEARHSTIHAQHLLLKAVAARLKIVSRKADMLAKNSICLNLDALLELLRDHLSFLRNAREGCLDSYKVPANKKEKEEMELRLECLVEIEDHSICLP